MGSTEITYENYFYVNNLTNFCAFRGVTYMKGKQTLESKEKPDLLIPSNSNFFDKIIKFSKRSEEQLTVLLALCPFTWRPCVYID